MAGRRRAAAGRIRAFRVMYQATAGQYALWFLIVLAFAKITACSLTIGIGGSGGVFAPSLFIGVASGMAYGQIVHHVVGASGGQPALYAVVAMGAVFASAARALLTSLASVVEMTGDFALTPPVMLAVAIATAISRALSYGTIYTTKLLRRGTDIDRTSLAQALRQLEVYGHDGLPVLSADGHQIQGWVAAPDALAAIARQITITKAQAAQGPGRRRLGPRRSGLTAAAPADPAARVPVHHDHHHRRFARRRAEAGRPHLAAGQHPGVSPARQPALAAPPADHPGTRRPPQPAHCGARRLTRTHPAGESHPQPATGAATIRDGYCIGRQRRSPAVHRQALVRAAGKTPAPPRMRWTSEARRPDPRPAGDEPRLVRKSLSLRAGRGAYRRPEPSPRPTRSAKAPPGRCGQPRGAR
jgi:Voltage gated chloride channel